ncbi:helix-turn-helix domain-containing protein [Dysosmobacter sp.]|uniref:helix-turn-helix domain-containing protein n=1 Tax=Dysosmobacter sp. TaxID=2591382 RepID=UPI002D810F88|nr:helix-turn-helix transcriptional regulator [uncultured Oscillibacter sp.]
MIFSRIRDLREDRDWNQTKVAEYLGVRQTTYSKYELGKLPLPVDVLLKLSDLYGVSVDYLLGRTDERTPYPKSRHQ